MEKKIHIKRNTNNQIAKVTKDNILFYFIYQIVFYSIMPWLNNVVLKFKFEKFFE